MPFLQFAQQSPALQGVILLIFAQASAKSSAKSAGEGAMPVF
jgi:hypothetical protein